MKMEEDDIEAQKMVVTEAQEKLKEACLLCKNINKQSRQQSIEAKKLVDQMQTISAKSRDTRKALGEFRNISDTVNFRNIQSVILHRAAELTKYLFQYNLLVDDQELPALGLLAEAHAKARAVLEGQDTSSSIPEQDSPYITFSSDFDLSDSLLDNLSESRKDSNV